MVDTPLSEGVIIGTAVGLAAEGIVPVPEIQFLGFSWQAFHQIAGQLARLRYRSDGRFDCPVTVRAPFGGGVRTPELHSEALEAQLVQCPGLKVVLPASAADAKGLLASAIRDPDPVMFLEPLKGYRLVKDDVPEGEHLVPLGQANMVRTGDDVVLIAWSAQVEVARERCVRFLCHLDDVLLSTAWSPGRIRVTTLAAERPSVVTRISAYQIRAGPRHRSSLFHRKCGDRNFCGRGRGSPG